MAVPDDARELPCVGKARVIRQKDARDRRPVRDASRPCADSRSSALRLKPDSVAALMDFQKALLDRLGYETE